VQTEFEAVVHVSDETQWGSVVQALHWSAPPDVSSQVPDEQVEQLESVAEVQVVAPSQLFTAVHGRQTDAPPLVPR
jgi:hypothetical protein